MHKYFSRPQTFGQWLPSSVSASVIGILIAEKLSSVSMRYALYPGWADALSFSWNGLLYLLGWWQVRVGLRLYTPGLRQQLVLAVAGALWLSLLGTCLLLFSLFLVFAGLLLCSGSDFSLNTH